MGDPLELHSQTRVLVINGQTLILQGDVGNNAINEINADLLEQALQEAVGSDGAGSGGMVMHQGQLHSADTMDQNHSVTPADMGTANGQQPQQAVGAMEEHENNNFVAIFETENGETQTVPITLEQAAALGFQVQSEPVLQDSKDELLALPQLKTTTVIPQDSLNGNTMPMPMMTSCAVTTSSQPMLPAPNQITVSQEQNILNTLLKPVQSNHSMISLMPQYVGNTMAYSVKLPEPMAANFSSPVVGPPLLGVTPNSVLAQPANNLASGPKICIPITQPNPSNQKIVVVPTFSTKSVAMSRPVTLKPTVKNAISTPMTFKTAPVSRNALPKLYTGCPANTVTSYATMKNQLPATSTASMIKSHTEATTTISSSVTLAESPNEKSPAPLSLTNASKPLGSSENPIQLVQHGHTYHSMQPLSQEQLKQIATVLQQKQLDTSRNSKNVLFDASTNTRIIYRVVYPEDLALKKPSVSSTMNTLNAKAGGRGGRKGRPPKGSSKSAHSKKNSEDEQSQDTDMTKGEKEERKKILLRTRSGRLSRPPRHMVKDYKRIHHLDFAEPDLDDSDGGYSDYRISDSENIPEPGQEDSATLEGEAVQRLQDPEGPAAVKRAAYSKFRCPKCQKMYLGYRRLARHFEAFPDHGSLEDIPTPSAPSEIQHGDTENINAISAVKAASGRSKGKRKGYHSLTLEERALRRKEKIKEFLSSHQISEIIETAGPIVAQSLDLWQFLLLRTSTINNHQSSCLKTVLEEIRSFLEESSAKVNAILKGPCDESGGVHKIEVSNPQVASALAISCGVYNVTDSEDCKLQWHPPAILEESDSNHLFTISSEPGSKKQRLWEREIKISDSVPDQNFSNSMDEKIFLDSMHSEKPSDTSLGSDTPLDDIVKAELKNLVDKAGLEDFVSAPALSTTSLSTTPVLSTTNSIVPITDYVTSSTTFTSSVSSNASEAHFPASLMLDMVSTPNHIKPVHATDSTITVQTKLPEFEMPSTNRLDLSSASISVNLEPHLTPAGHELDFDTLSEEFHTNVQS